MTTQGWIRAPFPDLVFFQEGPGLRKWQWTGSGMKVINVTNILGDGRVDTTNTDRFIALSEFEEKYSHFEIEADDILLASSGNTYGKLGRIGAEQLPVMMNTSVIRLHSSDKKRLIDGYLYGFLRSPDFKNQVEAFVNGSAQPNFGPTHLKRMTLSLPPLEVQRQIADILSAYDDLIELNRRRIAILEEMASRLFEEWFVKFRFPGCEASRLVETRTGVVPEGWQETALSKLADINSDTITPRHAPDMIRYIDISSVSPGTVNDIRSLRFDEAPGRARRRVKSGDTLWSMVRPNRRSYALLLQVDPDTVASTGFAVLRAASIPWSYLYLAVTTNQFASYLEGRARGSAYPAVSASDFEAALILVPSSELLKAFHSAAGPMLEAASVFRNQAAKLRAARDLLLPKLIAGEIDLGRAECGIRAVAERAAAE